jgi:hypothetical protein
MIPSKQNAALLIFAEFRSGFSGTFSLPLPVGSGAYLSVSRTSC